MYDFGMVYAIRTAALVLTALFMVGCAPSAAVTVSPAPVVIINTPSPPTQQGLVGLQSETPLELTATPYTYRAHYQAFERGFMAHAEDATCAYMFIDDGMENGIIIPDSERAEPFGAYHYCTEFTELPTAILAESAPTGLTLPADPFARLWVHYPEAREALGYAMLDDEWYSVTVFPGAIPIGFGGAPWQQPVISLPDGRTLQCGFRAATAGQCSL